MVMKLPVALLAIAASAQQPNTEWARYSATYTETITTTDSSGHNNTTQTVGEEFRSDDGSLLTTKTVNGERVSARLWQACGQMIDLDFIKKRAIYGIQSPRRHTYQYDKNVGTITIAGYQFKGIPITTSSGTVVGTMWIDMVDDITGKVEYQLPAKDSHQKDGHQSVVRQLTSVDLSAPVDASIMQVPTGFAKTTPSVGVPEGCLSKE